MPELPEVETVRRVLEKELVGRTLTAYLMGRPTFYRPPRPEALDLLLGRRLERVRRRGKYLLLGFAGGAEFTLHLGMSGRAALAEAGTPNGSPHKRLELELEGRALRILDPRRFGRAGCRLPPLGPEPLSPEFSAAALAASLRGRRAPVKALLMDQRIVAGLGNIYATEALFAAGVRPGRAGGSIKGREVERIFEAVRRVLERAVELGGSTLPDEAFLDPRGRPGRAQQGLSVYGREAGLCGHPLKATASRIGGRTSLYCPECQR